MDHYYKYEGMREEDRNGLIPYHVALTASKIDPEDQEPDQRGETNDPLPGDTQPIKTPSRGRTGPWMPASGTERTFRIVMFRGDMGSYTTTAHSWEDLLLDVNSARDHDGLKHITLEQLKNCRPKITEIQ
jgi:hypothetical protein